MPTRDIKESCRTSYSLASISHGAERLFWRLTTYADDYGRMPADVAVTRAACFPVMLQKVSANDVRRWLSELVTADLLRVYTGPDGKQYAFFPTWPKHQRMRAKHSKYPPPTSADRCPPMSADVAGTTETTENTEVLPKLPKTPKRQQPRPRGEDADVTDEPAAWGKPENLVALYNAAAPDNVAAVEELSAKRRERARLALRQYPEEPWWKEVFVQYRRSRFLSGLVKPTDGHRSFRPDFDWLLSTGKNGVENYVKVHDGMYAD